MSTRVRNQFPTVQHHLGPMAFVGEAPARQECIEGVPFVGPAGYEFDVWLKSASILRATCFVGNLSQERAPGDRIDAMLVDQKTYIPNPRLSMWIEELRQDLVRLKPRCIVALGDKPLFFLTGKRGITKYWGSILPCTMEGLEGIWVTALPHPSYIIRGLKILRPVINVWMRRAASVPYVLPPERTYLLDPTYEQVVEELTRLKDSPAVAFDIETEPVPVTIPPNPDGHTIPLNANISCISFSDRNDWAISIPFQKNRHHRWEASIEAYIWRLISEILRGPAIKIAHNLLFDGSQLSSRRIWIAPPYYDTMMAHHVCYPDLSSDELKKMKMNSLAFCTALYTLEPYYKQDHKSYNEFDPKWRGQEIEFWLYNAKDSAVCFEVYERTRQDLIELSSLESFQHDMRVFEALFTMSLTGIKRDVEKLKELRLEVYDKISELQAKLNEIAEEPLNVRSSQQMAKVLYSYRGLPIQYKKAQGKDKGGRITTDEYALSKLATLSDDPIIPATIELRRLLKFQSTYLDSELSPDERTRTAYNQARTTTFRLSSTGSVLGGGMNLQNQPTRKRGGYYDTALKKFKQTFVADSGKYFGRRDLSQAEAVVVAYLSGDVELIADFAKKIDIHSKAAAIIFGKDYEDFRGRYLDGDPEAVKQRYLGKKGRHATNYKTTANRLQSELLKDGDDLPLSVCKQIIGALRSACPALTQWHYEVEETVRRTRTLTTCLGRRRYFMGPITDDLIRAAIAFDPQCTVAHVLNIGIERIYNDPINSEILWMLMNIHDAFYWESPAELVIPHGKHIGELMSVPLEIKGRRFTILSDFEVGPTWGDMKEVK